MALYPLPYLISWIVLSGLAGVLAGLRGRSFAICRRAYWQRQLAGWRVASAILAWLALLVVAPYSGDPTWDAIDTTFMCGLTFATAPWAVGVVWKGLRGASAWDEVFVAVCAALFSSAWAYDAYMLMRGDPGPILWRENLPASLGLYVAAGLTWSLDWTRGRGVHLAFVAPEWPGADPDAGEPRLGPLLPGLVSPGLLLLVVLALSVGWLR
jgi:hypothetical protein